MGKCLVMIVGVGDTDNRDHACKDLIDRVMLALLSLTHPGITWQYIQAEVLPPSVPGTSMLGFYFDRALRLSIYLAITSSKMAPRTWLTADQQTFLLTYRDEYLECQKKGNYSNFWPPFFEKWEDQWPPRASLNPAVPMDQPLTPEQLMQEAEIRTAVQTRLIVKLRNDNGHSKAARKANGAGNSVVNKLLKKSEVYAKKYYASRVQPYIKDELNAIKEQSNPPEPKANLHIIRKHVAQCWESESTDVKEEISQLAREMREARREAAKEKEPPEITNEEIVPRLTEILSTFFGELHKATGWTFSVLLGGPDPSNEGAIDVSSLHVGSTKLGNRFNQVFAKFNDNVMVPYYEFVSHVFPEAALQKETAAKRLEGEDLLRFSATPDDIPTMDNLLAPNIPSVPPDPDFFCFETSPESDLPTLPMPDGYIPSPSPPLPYAKDTSPFISMFLMGIRILTLSRMLYATCSPRVPRRSCYVLIFPSHNDSGRCSFHFLNVPVPLLVVLPQHLVELLVSHLT
ncbi:hypothetical protein BDR05DRAFT_951759 [Suillus weaverae]|nr:hypothetical protein BDR05DRAFT_951759 [Suillus weaverae]